MKRAVLIMTVLLLMLPVCGRAAEDEFSADLYSRGRMTTERDYLRVACDFLEAERVSLSVTGPDGLVFMKNYGPCSGKFRSDRIFLNAEGDAAEYTVTAEVDGETLSFTVCRLPVSGVPTEARTAGTILPDGSEVCVLDEAGTGRDRQIVPLVTADDRRAGYVTLRLEDGRLTVTADLDIAGSVRGGTVYVTRDVTECCFFGSDQYKGMTGAPGQSIRVGGTGPIYVYAILNVKTD
ncbi:MAG: hypothetical protein MJ142_00375 [Clostridia bacterium]|nr:hypothetical protein [Clostridia bacterium]